jgi:hypothetical protein
MVKEQRLFPDLGFGNYGDEKKQAFFNTRDYALGIIEFEADSWAEYTPAEKHRRTDLFVEAARWYIREHEYST